MNAYAASPSVCRCPIFLSSDGTTFTWGQNEREEYNPGLEYHKPIPVRLPGGYKIKAATGGECHFLALTEDGHLFSWGQNDKLQLGRPAEGLDIYNPEKVAFLPPFFSSSLVLTFPSYLSSLPSFPPPVLPSCPHNKEEGEQGRQEGREEGRKRGRGEGRNEETEEGGREREEGRREEGRKGGLEKKKGRKPDPLD
jgi:hypothetical protein